MKEYETLIICDLAETYNILDYKKLPPKTVASLVFGLKEDSRLKMRLSNLKVDTKTLLLAGILDGINLLVWSKTKDAEKGLNKPESVSRIFISNSRESVEIGFDSSEDFIEERASLVEELKRQGVKNGN